MIKGNILFLAFFYSCSAFAPAIIQNKGSFISKERHPCLFSTEEDIDLEGPRNPDRPELPEIKGDYNWDDKFKDDPDWITENVAGRVVMNEVDLAVQSSSLTKIEEKYRKIRLADEYEDARILGWTDMAQTYNGRFAMFFLVVGLLTEYWTGISIPGQIEEMARVGGFIGPEF